jgi:hypothetical protein
LVQAFAAGGFVELFSEEDLRCEKFGPVSALHIDDIVGRSGLNWSEVLATLFDLERKAIVRSMLGL